MARTHGRGGAGIRKTNKKGATKGSGGQRRKGLAGKGPTPKAEDRIYHCLLYTSDAADDAPRV